MTTELNELDIVQEINEVFNPGEGEFVIDDAKKLAWVLGKIEVLQGRINEHAAIASSKKAKLNEIFGRLTEQYRHDFEVATTGYKHELESLLNRFGLQIFMFTQQRIAKRKNKSERFGQAQVGFKKALDKFEIKDEQALLTWAYANNQDLVKVVESVPVKELKAYYESTGEIPDGVHTKQGEDQFFIKVAGHDLTPYVTLEVEPEAPAEEADNQSTGEIQQGVDNNPEDAQPDA